MPLTLILTRHAKSAWEDATLDDFHRPLNARGRASATNMGKWLISRGHLPDTVLVSGARRTVETWARMSEMMPATCTMESVPALYLADAGIILNVLRARRSPVIMLIAHNPGIGDFAHRILAQRPSHEKFGKYPTCATTVMTFNATAWKEIGWGDGQLVDFVVPRELESSRPTA